MTIKEKEKFWKFRWVGQGTAVLFYNSFELENILLTENDLKDYLSGKQKPCHITIPYYILEKALNERHGQQDQAAARAA